MDTGYSIHVLARAVAPLGRHGAARVRQHLEAVRREALGACASAPAAAMHAGVVRTPRMHARVVVDHQRRRVTLLRVEWMDEGAVRPVALG